MSFNLKPEDEIIEMECPECKQTITDFYEKVFPKPIINQKPSTIINTMPPKAEATETAANEPKPDYKQYVGKTFRLNEARRKEAPHHADYRFKVLEHIPNYDFGVTQGGVKDAFRVHRLSPTGIHTPSCKKFLADHEEVPAQEAK